MDDQRVEVPGSSTKPRSNERRSSCAGSDEEVGATIILRRPGAADNAAALKQELLSGQLRSMPKEQALHAMAADPSDLAAVQSFVQRYGLNVTSENAEARSLHIRGTIAQMNAAFGIQLGWFEDANGKKHLSYEGAISVPQSLAGIVIAVLGLDQRPIAKHHSPTN